MHGDPLGSSGGCCDGHIGSSHRNWTLECLTQPSFECVEQPRDTGHAAGQDNRLVERLFVEFDVIVRQLGQEGISEFVNRLVDVSVERIHHTVFDGELVRATAGLLDDIGERLEVLEVSMSFFVFTGGRLVDGYSPLCFFFNVGGDPAIDCIARDGPGRHAGELLAAAIRTRAEGRRTEVHGDEPRSIASRPVPTAEIAPQSDSG